MCVKRMIFEFFVFFFLVRCYIRGFCVALGSGLIHPHSAIGGNMAVKQPNM